MCNFVAILVYLCDMIAKIEEFAAILREHGCSVTKSRRSVFETLCTHEQLSMHDLVTSCSDIDRASVYRTVELLERLNIAQKVYTGWKYRVELTDIFHDHHHHANCTVCHATILLAEDSKIESLLAKQAAKQDFKLLGHQIELTGICSKCSQSAATKKLR